MSSPSGCASTPPRLDELRYRINEVLDEVDIDPDQFDLPEIPALPAPQLHGNQQQPLLDSRWDFAEQCRALIASKSDTNGQARS